jgi:hypothetical protein
MLDPIDNFFFYLIQVEIEHPIIEGPKYIYIYIFRASNNSKTN